VLLTDPATGEELITLRHPDPGLIVQLCFSPNGDRLAAATLSQVVHLWDLKAIREQLAAMGLDWTPEPSPAPASCAQDAAVAPPRSSSSATGRFEAIHRARRRGQPHCLPPDGRRAVYTAGVTWCLPT
jgi:WD40 repeat protein